MPPSLQTALPVRARARSVGPPAHRGPSSTTSVDAGNGALARAMGLARKPGVRDGIDPWADVLDLPRPTGTCLLQPASATATPGVYPGVVDRTADFGGLGRKRTNRAIDEIVMHRTGAPTGRDTMDDYTDRVANGAHRGAHYLVDEGGGTSLTVPLADAPDQVVGHNQRSVGVEITGAPSRVDLSKGAQKSVREQVSGLNLPPRMRARLLGKSDPDLRSALSGSGDGGQIYEDISADQKRAVWNLSSRLAADKGLSIPEDVHAHEDLQAKTLGEGEPAVEFLQSMAAYPAKVDRLREKVTAMQSGGPAPGQSPEAFEAALHDAERELAREQETLDATRADLDPDEQNRVQQEACLGVAGDATRRERLRRAFYGRFYRRMERLDGMTAP